MLVVASITTGFVMAGKALRKSGIKLKGDVILAFAGGGGILVYLVAWVLIPVERPGEDLGDARPEGADTTRLIVGGALIAVGTILLLNLSLPALGRYFWPLALIAVGVAVVIQASSSRR